MTLIPESASDWPIEEKKNGPPTFGDAYLMNPFAGVEMLTFDQAIDLINMISGEILADRINREPSKEEH